MAMLTAIRRLLDHSRWADLELLRALGSPSGAPAEALRELAHVVAAEVVWLARLEQRPARVSVWPELALDELTALAAAVHEGYAAYLSRLTEASAAATVEYANSAGRRFQTPAGDILLHVALHGQYHRGKVNLLLRQAGLAPAPADYIAFVRGSPAATTPRS